MPLALTGYEIGLLTSALVFIAFALVVALVIPRSRPTFPSNYLGWFIAACIVLFAVQMTAVILLAEGEEEHEEVAQESEPSETTPTDTGATGTTETGTTETTTAGNSAAGREVFAGEGGCGSCHTLADAGATGTIGPNLDAASPSLDLAVDRVTNGAGAMPAFGDSLSEQQIADVAAYVSSAAGG